MKLFFATDVHGSELCWKKFINAGKFYGVDVLILGGDMTGKAIVPIIAQGNGKYKVTLLFRTEVTIPMSQIPMKWQRFQARKEPLTNFSSIR